MGLPDANRLAFHWWEDRKGCCRLKLKFSKKRDVTLQETTEHDWAEADVSNSVVDLLQAHTVAGTDWC
jgi:hypothetical protein